MIPAALTPMTIQPDYEWYWKYCVSRKVTGITKKRVILLGMQRPSAVNIVENFIHVTVRQIISLRYVTPQSPDKAEE